MPTRLAARRTLGRLVSAPEEWDRRKLQLALGVAVVLTILLLTGIACLVLDLIRGGRAQDAQGSDPEITVLDEAPHATLEDAQPQPLSNATTGTLRIPQPGTLGPAQVGTGFPRTPEGALAQLVAIDQRAMQSASVVTAQDVVASWAESGGPRPETWSGVEAVAVLLDAAGQPADGTTDIQIVLRPAMGLIRATSVDAVIPCVDFVLTTTVTRAQPSRIAVADCQRMVWRDGRWLIGAGPEPEPSPSLWPGTQASYDAGYLWLEVEP
jgi:hypothetical protein